MDVDVKYVSGDALNAEWALAYSDEAAYFIVRGDAVCPRVLREALQELLRLSGQRSDVGNQFPRQYNALDRLPIAQ